MDQPLIYLNMLAIKAVLKGSGRHKKAGYIIHRHSSPEIALFCRDLKKQLAALIISIRWNTKMTLK